GGGSTIAALADIAGTMNYPVLPGFHGSKTKMGEYTKSDKVFEMQVPEI
ncbi:hypothetical protein ALC53_10312, partial [Atta colombica]